MSYRLEIGPKARAAGRLIGSVRLQLASAIEEERTRTGLSNRALARKLGIRQSMLTKILSGEAALTLRALAEIGWALERSLSFRFQLAEPSRPGSNEDGPSTNFSAPMVFAGNLQAANSTLPSPRPITMRREGERARPR